jgi:hypothetical protein|tara:strand:- start:22669 stop:23181 length:513 start_codon:yes stop_codon:yes gene_type:complete
VGLRGSGPILLSRHGARLDRKVRASRAALRDVLKLKLLQKTSRRKAIEIGRRHYDIGNDLFTVMLDRQMNYSCAYWQQAENLDAAQEAKLDLTCRKLMPEEDMRILDIGCGWGGQDLASEVLALLNPVDFFCLSGVCNKTRSVLKIWIFRLFSQVRQLRFFPYRHFPKKE